MKAMRGAIKRDGAVFFERLEHLKQEERVARGARKEKLSEGLHLGRWRAQRVGHERSHIALREGREGQHLHLCATRMHIIERDKERMASGHSLIAMRHDQEQMRCLGVGREHRQKANRRAIRPLQIIEEEHERRCLGGQATRETTCGNRETNLGLRSRQRGRRMQLSTDERVQLRDEACEQRNVLTQGRAGERSHALDFLIALREHHAKALTKGLRQHRKRLTTIELIAFARSQRTPEWRDALTQLKHECRLTDARLTDDAHDRDGPRLHLLKAREQRGHLSIASIEARRGLETPAHIALTELKGCNRLVLIRERSEAALQVFEGTERRLIAVFRSLLQEAHRQL